MYPGPSTPGTEDLFRLSCAVFSSAVRGLGAPSSAVPGPFKSQSQSLACVAGGRFSYLAGHLPGEQRVNALRGSPQKGRGQNPRHLDAVVPAKAAPRHSRPLPTPARGHQLQNGGVLTERGGGSAGAMRMCHVCENITAMSWGHYLSKAA